MRFRNGVNEVLTESMTEIRDQVFKLTYLLNFLFKSKPRPIGVAEKQLLKIPDDGASFDREYVRRMICFADEPTRPRSEN